MREREVRVRETEREKEREGGRERERERKKKVYGDPFSLGGDSVGGAPYQVVGHVVSNLG